MASSSGLGRTKSDQLVVEKSAVAAMKSPVSSASGRADAVAYGGGGGAEGGSVGGGAALSRKSSRRMSASPGGGKNTHIRKSRSAQLKIDIDEVSSGAALSRASSASLGFSFSFTGFVPPDEIADSRPFSDDDIRTYIPPLPFST